MSPPDPASFFQWLTREWAEKFLQSAEAMSGEPVQSEPAEFAWSAAEGDLIWNQPFDAGPGSEVTVVSPEGTWSAVGSKVLKAAGIDDAEPDDSRATYLEILQQSLSSVASSLHGVFGREVACKSGKAITTLPSVDGVVEWFRLTAGGAELGLIGIQVPRSFHDLAGNGQAQADSAEKATTGPGSPINGGTSGSGDAQTRGQGDGGAMSGFGGPSGTPSQDGARGRGSANQTIELLYDVELPVAVSFGRAHLPLKEVVKLTSGSIVELNRAVAEPVELIVNNCVIARAEVVVVDGNYGVRILEIVSQRERLRTLH
ncbi:MAG: flagellar motor switch protein FliN [Bryobacteraceae bacterium]